LPNPQLVDIHCHLLPQLDDGAADWDETLQMARIAASEGIRAIVATPHQLGNHADLDAELIRQRLSQLHQQLRDARITLTVVAGADVRIEPELLAKLKADKVLTLADRRRHVLLELPHELYVPLDKVLADLRRAGMQGVLSHPERNCGILRRPELLSHLLEAGCLFQVTAGSLLGDFGPRVRELAEHIATQQIAHFLATDAHGSRCRRPVMREAFRRLAELAGEQAAIRACCENPTHVLAGQRVPAGRPQARAARWRWLPGRRAG